MYRCNDVDDDSDILRSRGQDLKNHLRQATRCAGDTEDPQARAALYHIIEALRLISEILYDVCPPPERRLVAMNLRERRELCN